MCSSSVVRCYRIGGLLSDLVKKNAAGGWSRRGRRRKEEEKEGATDKIREPLTEVRE